LNTSEKILLLYENAIKDENQLDSFCLLVSIFVKYRWGKIRYYNSLKETLKNKPIKDIDFSIYDKISSLIYEFNNNLSSNWNSNTKIFMEWVLNTNKNSRALLIDVRSRLIERSPKEFELEYDILTNLIDMEEKYILDLENTYKDLYSY
ncbi:hypothetical protein G8T83_13980, partial [Clostridium botulinum D/C]